MIKHPSFEYLKLYLNYKKELRSILFLCIVKHGAWMAFPLIIKFVIDDFIPAQNLQMIFLCIPITLALGLINLATHTPFQVILTGMIKNVSRDLRSTIINKVQILSISYLNKSETGRYYSKIMVDVNKTEALANALFNQSLGTCFTFLYAGAVLAYWNWKMMLTLFLILPVFAVIYRFFTKRFKKYQEEARRADESLSQSVSHFLQTNTLTRMHGEENFEREKIDASGEKIIEKYKRIQGYLAAFMISNLLSGQMFQIIVVAFGAVAVINGKLKLGELVIFSQYTQQINFSIIHVMDIFPQFIQSAESIKSINEILFSTETEENENKRIVKDVHGVIEFQNVVYGYTSGRSALNGVSIKIEPGKTVALVGPSGSGKTTFIHLALGILRPQSGKILIDGNNVNDLDMRSVRKFVGVVTQQPILFRGTIAENIAHARDNDIKEIEEAARKANAHDFIIQTEKKYDTIIGEHGSTLSGGQRQRIAIARAILRKPKILIMDEATSALDSIAEQEVQKGIDALLGNQTTLTIAHRLSTVKHADIILVFEKGKIVEQGTHAELVDRNGVYTSLYQAQFKDQEEDAESP